jgi:hypothetical protein
VGDFLVLFSTSVVLKCEMFPPSALTVRTFLLDTTIAYMYDLCLKRLSRKARSARKESASRRDGDSEGDDPHVLIQQVLLSEEEMPALRYFISTYSPQELLPGGECNFKGHNGNTWLLVLQKKLPCSTDSYMFYVYERVRSSTEGQVLSCQSVSTLSQDDT